MGEIYTVERTKLDPEVLVEAVLRRPNLDLYELIMALGSGVLEVYEALAELKGDARICQDNCFMISTLDGPLSFGGLDQLIKDYTADRSDITKAVRLSMTLDLLNTKTPTGGVTISDLAERTGVVERTVRRDLKDIEKFMDVKIIALKDTKPIKYLLNRVFLPSMSPEQAVIIFLGLLQQKGSALAGHVNEIKDALITHLFKNRYSTESLEIEKLQDRIYIIEEALADPQRVGVVFGKIIAALKNNNRVSLLYHTVSRGEESRRVVEPYGLVCKRQNWYLVAYCHKSQEVRTFRVDQIRDVYPRVFEKFAYPADFSLKEHMGQAWGVIRSDQVCRVRLKFNAPVAHMPRTVTYHPSQEIEEELPDGSVAISFQVCGLIELTSWITQWGGNVEVLEPQELRDKVRETALRIAGMHD